MTARSRRTFEELVTLPDLGIPVAETALLLACEEYPQLSLAPYLNRLDRIADRVSARLDGNSSAHQTIRVLNDVIFKEHGFHGNDQDYYDPRNSYLNDVLDRRTGIPITLSTIYMEVSRRVGFRVEGVGMPGHFIVKHVSPNEEIFLDPFNAGTLLTRQDCRDLVRRVQGGEAQNEDHWLRRVSPRQIVMRMLNNLKLIYVQGGALDKATIMLDLMILTEPSNPTLYKERGMLRLKLRRYRPAASDLEHYLGLASHSKDRSEVEDCINDLRRLRAMMN